jgi:allantoinase
MNDLVIRNALVADGGTVRTMDLAMDGGRFSAAGPGISATGRREIDAAGLHVFPGLIDAHVHFNEPGRDDWEGLTTGPQALALGGGTVFFDMPLNSHPPVLNRAEFAVKRGLAEQKSVLDFALWGGLCPGHVSRLDEMAEAGAVGFKAFLCPSGIDEFPATDPGTLREGLRAARRWNLPVAVHAEDPALLREPTKNGRTMADFLASRPPEAEIAAVRLACELAGETGASLHVVHVSCAESLAVIAAARAAGVEVTAEVCPHHLLFDADDAVRIGARAKCAPPLRPAAEVSALWRALADGKVDTIGSDHSPAPPARKTGDDAFQIWGGISGCQHAFVSLLGALAARSPDLLAWAADAMAHRVAERFRLPGKGRVAEGFDADLTFVRFGDFPAIRRKDLQYRHPFSLYENCRPTAQVVHVVRRGELIVENGALRPNPGRGRFLRPAPTR